MPRHVGEGKDFRLAGKVARFGRQLGFEDTNMIDHMPEWGRSILGEVRKLLQSDRHAADPARDLLEDLYSQKAPYGYRKVRGQFFTPPPVASFMVRWALNNGATSFLDPSVGTGIFMREALAQARARGGSHPRLIGYETDPILAEIARMGIQALGFPVPDIRESDFLTDQAPTKFDAVVANPPYVRHHEMTYADDVFRWFDQKFGFRLSRLTNLYGLFLLKIHLSLSEAGRAAVLIPSEFLNADFSVRIKRFLMNIGHLDTLIIFDNSQLEFNDILTTACVALLDTSKRKDQPLRVVHLPDTGAIGDVAEALLGGDGFRPDGSSQQVLIEKEAVAPESKWTSLGLGQYRGKSSKLVPLGTIARTMRGIATGANPFFTLNTGEIGKYGIERKYLRPCITKAHHAPHMSFSDDDFARLRISGKKSYILYYEGGAVSEALRDYIDLGESQRLHERFLTRHREPWFLTERCRIAPILVTVFGRKGLRFTLNKAKMWNLTAFHCIYPEFDDQDMERALMAYLVSNECAELMRLEWRVYGDGLLKMEPRDVARVPTLDISSLAVATIEELASLFERLCEIERLNPEWRQSPEMVQTSKVVRQFL